LNLIGIILVNLPELQPASRTISFFPFLFIYSINSNPHDWIIMSGIRS